MDICRSIISTGIHSLLLVKRFICRFITDTIINNNYKIDYQEISSISNVIHILVNSPILFWYITMNEVVYNVYYILILVLYVYISINKLIVVIFIYI